MKLPTVRSLPPLLNLLLWSVVVVLVSFLGLALLGSDTEEPEEIVSESEDEFRGNNIRNYIELIEMPPETVFETIRVMITNKDNGSVLYAMSDYKEVKKEIEAEGYRGEIYYYQAGNSHFVVVNELPLEEYLYGVVPSEMPSSYPMEALKAQAICARTYAVIHMMNPAYPAYQAHVDDTTSFQVYHNIDEQERTNQAVDETRGMLLFESNGEELAETYYYSTSCGLSTEVFNNIEFEEYITTTNSSDFEVNESWYRWTYEVTEIDTDEMLKRIQARYKVNKSNILTYVDVDRNLCKSNEIKELGRIRELFISDRGTGGVAQEMIIRTDKNIYKIYGEYNIRYILNDADESVLRQDGKQVTMPTLLPSAFISLEAVKKNNTVVGYKIVGGGYGHGVGMSQNAAKEMANQGYTTDEILTNFYPDCFTKDDFNF